MKEGSLFIGNTYYQIVNNILCLVNWLSSKVTRYLNEERIVFSTNALKQLDIYMQKKETKFKPHSSIQKLTLNEW